MLMHVFGEKFTTEILIRLVKGMWREGEYDEINSHCIWEGRFAAVFFE